ncbi:phage tail protein, partial [Bacillus mycoides]|nr:phage tail protein [Bacillus mycoides]
NAGAAQSGFNSINGTPFGIKGGSDFARGIGSQSGQANSAGNQVKSSGESGIKGSDTYSLGSDFASGFARGIRGGGSLAASAAQGLASMAMGAAKRWLEVRSPSRKVKREIGFHFGSGFALGIQSSTDLVENESRALSMNAYDSLANGLNPNKLANAGIKMANGIASGIKSQSSIIRDALQDTVSGAMDGIRSIRPEEIFSLQGDNPLTKYFNAIFIDGDWQNDWITHIPESMRDMVREIGRQMERFEGLSLFDVGRLSKWREVLSDNPNVIQYRSDNNNPDKQTRQPTQIV